MSPTAVVDGSAVVEAYGRTLMSPFRPASTPEMPTASMFISRQELILVLIRPLSTIEVASMAF